MGRQEQKWSTFLSIGWFCSLKHLYQELHSFFSSASCVILLCSTPGNSLDELFSYLQTYLAWHHVLLFSIAHLVSARFAVRLVESKTGAFSMFAFPSCCLTPYCTLLQCDLPCCHTSKGLPTRVKKMLIICSWTSNTDLYKPFYL